MISAAMKEIPFLVPADEKGKRRKKGTLFPYSRMKKKDPFPITLIHLVLLLLTFVVLFSLFVFVDNVSDI